MMDNIDTLIRLYTHLLTIVPISVDHEECVDIKIDVPDANDLLLKVLNNQRREIRNYKNV
jgi:hypothetical protein